MEGVKQKIMQSFVSTRIEWTQKKGKKMTLSPKLNTLRKSMIKSRCRTFLILELVNAGRYVKRDCVQKTHCNGHNPNE